MMSPLPRASHRFFHQHPGQFLLAVIGLAAGVAVVTGVALMRDVLIDSLDRAGELLAGAGSLRIEHPSGVLDEGLVTDLASRRGAPVLIPVLREPVRTDGRRMELLATDPVAALADGRLPLGGGALESLLGSKDAFAVNHDTARRLDLAAGEKLEVTINGRDLTLTLSATLDAGRALDDRLLMDIAVAQHLLGRRGEIDFIEAPESAADWLGKHLESPHTITPAQERRQSAARLTEGMRANLTAMSLISLAVGLFVIHSVLSFLLVQRRRSFGMLRAVGVTSGRLRTLVLSEALVVAALGALLGLAAGTGLADSLLALVRQPLAELYRLLPPASVQPTATLYGLIWVGAVVLAAISVTTLWREVDRIPPGLLARLPESMTPRGWLPPTAMSVLFAGAALAWFTASLAGALVSLLVALVGFGLLAPAMGMRLLGLLAAPWRRQLPGRALAMLAAGRARIAPALSALSLALALSAGIAMMVLGFRAAVDDWVAGFLRADVYLSVARGNIDTDLAGRVAALDGIEAVSSARRARLPDGRILVAYDLPDAAWRGFEWLAGGGEAARRAFAEGRGVLVSEPFARHRDAVAGDRLQLHSPEGRLDVEIVGVYRDYASDQGTIAIHAPVYRRHWNDDVRDSLGLYLATPVDTGLPALKSRLSAFDEDIRLTTRDQVREQTLGVFDRTFRISWALAILVGLIALIALISALLALGLERRREYATLRALGATRLRLAGVVISQTAGLAAAAALVAVPLAAGIHLALSLIVQPLAFGWSLPLSWPLQPLMVMVPLAVAAGAAAGLYPAWRIARRAPATELRQR